MVIPYITFADDLNIIGSSEAEIIILLNIVKEFCNDTGFDWQALMDQEMKLVIR